MRVYRAKGTLRRGGATGASMSGGSVRAAFKHNLQYAIKAKDIAEANNRQLFDADAEVLEMCRLAQEHVSEITEHQSRVIFAVWQQLAEAGKLRGIRTPIRAQSKEEVE
jgi:hypothetical protein